MDVLGLLTSIPGIGFITASQPIARIGNWRHLYRYDQIGSFLGLVPSEDSTGDEINRGSITRMGNTNLKRTRTKDETALFVESLGILKNNPDVIPG
ncbi:MAG: transposase [Elusimicrobiota bacterium]